MSDPSASEAELKIETWKVTKLISLARSTATIDWQEEEAYEALTSQLPSSNPALRGRSSGGKYDASGLY